MKCKDIAGCLKRGLSRLLCDVPGDDSFCWGCIPFVGEEYFAEGFEALQKHGVAEDRVFVGGDFMQALERCKSGDRLVVYLSGDASERRAELCDLIMAMSRRGVDFQGVGAYDFLVRHDDYMLCNYLLLYDLLTDLYRDSAERLRAEPVGKVRSGLKEKVPGCRK